MAIPGSLGHGAILGEHAAVHVAAKILDRGLAEASETGSYAFKLRPYQLEMLEESMQRNIIVAV